MWRHNVYGHRDVALAGVTIANKNYEAGRRLEYAVRDHYIDDGYTVLRTAGSHGPFDLVAFNTREVLMIQCKRVSTQAEVRRLMVEWAKNPPCPPLSAPFKQVIAIKLKGYGEPYFKVV